MEQAPDGRPPTRIVVFFDANMPSPDYCRPGCREDEHCLCVHRFGPNVRIIEGRTPLKEPGVSDLAILRYVIQVAIAGIRGATLDGTEWLLLTKDQTFCQSAKHQYRSIRGPVSQVLDFGDCCVATDIGGKVLHVKILTIFARFRPGILWSSIAKIRARLQESAYYA